MKGEEVTTAFAEAGTHAGGLVIDYIEAQKAELEARKTRDGLAISKKQIEADFAQQDWTGTNQKVRDAQMEAALSESESYQGVLVGMREAEYEMRENDIIADGAKLTIRLAMLMMEHETAKAADVRIFDKFDGQPNEHGNAVPR